MPKNVSLEKKAFERLVALFEECVIDTLEHAEFRKTPFPNDHFGREGRDYMYFFYSMRDTRQLDMIECHLLAKELQVKIYFNSVIIDQEIDIFEASEGLGSTALHIAPFSFTRKSVHRWKPIPFLKIPEPYKVHKLSSEADIEPKIESVIRRVCDDLENVDIIRAEWDADHEPEHITIDRLTLK
ncbi:hypothetical protein [Salipiger abyssi]|uniref:hypothetical protein n=1 Tax=Salipiger abyssi TaxID=1250539 RepID=UPI0012EC222D|nr:hypothetical protein [Salipiger abyssi]